MTKFETHPSLLENFFTRAQPLFQIRYHTTLMIAWPKFLLPAVHLVWSKVSLNSFQKKKQKMKKKNEEKKNEEKQSRKSKLHIRTSKAHKKHNVWDKKTGEQENDLADKQKRKEKKDRARANVETKDWNVDLAVETKKGSWISRVVGFERRFTIDGINLREGFLFTFFISEFRFWSWDFPFSTWLGLINRLYPPKVPPI